MSWILSAVSRLIQIGYGFWHDLVVLANKVVCVQTPSAAVSVCACV
jgi:hypothetical protein